MRRIKAAILTACTAAAVVAGTTAAPAQAQTGLDLIKILNGNVATANCDVLRVTLRGTGLANDNTTRSQLVNNVNKAVGAEPALRLVTGPTVNALGDRALECGIVKPDPVTPFDELIKMSSQMSSQRGLPDIRTFIPAR